MALFNHLALVLILLLCCVLFHSSAISSSAISKSNSKLSVVTLNIANYDDHHHWDTRVKLIVRDLIEVNADLIALQEVRSNPDHSSTKETFQNQAEQILFQLNEKGKYLGAQLVTQPTMYYPFHIPQYEHSFAKIMDIEKNNATLPSKWEEGIRGFLRVGDYESVREFIRKQYKNHGILQGDYVMPKDLSPEQVSMEWEGSAIISKRRILETGSIFMSKPSNCFDLNKRATQFVSVSFESPDSALSPHFHVEPSKRFYFFNTHLGLETPCAISEIQETREYMKRFSGPTLLVGDFNIEPTHEALKKLRNFGFTDLWQHLHQEHNDSNTKNVSVVKKVLNEVGQELLEEKKETRTKCQYDGWCTFPSYKPIKRIDYAWANNKLLPHVSQMRRIGTKAEKVSVSEDASEDVSEDASEDVIFPSDHFGYVIEFNFHQKYQKLSSMQLSPMN